MRKTLATIDAVSLLWNAYWQGGRTDEARNALMEHYLPLVRMTAARLASRNGRCATPDDIDDLQQFGVFGLRDCIRGFDPVRGFKFESYSARRLRGAMLDDLQTSNWVPRDVRHRLSRFHAAQEAVDAQYGSDPRGEAVARRLGVCPAVVAQFRREAATTQISSLNTLESGEERELRGGDIVPDYREISPDDAVQHTDVRELFMRELTPSERRLMMLYYFEHFTMREIGEVLGVSGTRVSQLHSEIVTRLHQCLARRMTSATGISRDILEI